MKIKARVRAKGQRGTGWYNQTMVNYLRKRSRTQMLWTLTLSGDFHLDYETSPVSDLRAHHMMRVMMTANVAARVVIMIRATVGARGACGLTSVLRRLSLAHAAPAG